MGLVSSLRSQLTNCAQLPGFNTHCLTCTSDEKWLCRKSDLLRVGSASCSLPSAPPAVGKGTGRREAVGHVNDASALLGWQKINGAKQTLEMGSLS